MVSHRVGRAPNSAPNPRLVSAGKQPRSRPLQSACNRRLPMPVTPTGTSSLSRSPPSPPTNLSSSATNSPSGSASSPTSSSDTSPLRDITNTSQLQQELAPGAGTQAEEVDLHSFVAESRKAFSEILGLLNDDNIKSRRRKASLPRTLTSNVRATLKNLYGNDLTDAWDLNESFTSIQNEEVNVSVTAAVQNIQKIPTNLIRDALRVYYRSRRRQFRMSENKKANYLKQQRFRTRLNLKRMQRVKSLQETTAISDSDKEKYSKVMTNDYMSSEESTEDIDESDGENEEEQPTSTIGIRKLPWRSHEVNELFSALDRRTVRKRSRKGKGMVIARVQEPVASVRHAPENAPQWALQQ